MHSLNWKVVWIKYVIIVYVQGSVSSLVLGLLNMLLGNMHSYEIQHMHWCNTIMYKKGVPCSSATWCGPSIHCSTIISNPDFTLSMELLTLLWHNWSVCVCDREWEVGGLKRLWFKHLTLIFSPHKQSIHCPAPVIVNTNSYVDISSQQARHRQRQDVITVHTDHHTECPDTLL